jgi:hypothetical protein
MTFLIAIIALLVLIISINYLQNNYVDYLPEIFHTWDFLPIYFRSLKPYDDFIVKYLCSGQMCKKIIEESKNNDKVIQESKNIDNNLKVVYYNTVEED